MLEITSLIQLCGVPCKNVNSRFDASNCWVSLLFTLQWSLSWVPFFFHIYNYFIDFIQFGILVLVLIYLLYQAFYAESLITTESSG